MSRRIKTFGGRKATVPIKSEKMIKDIFIYLTHEREHAKSPIKKYQTDRNYMLFLIGFNTAFRGEDLLQLRVKDVINGYISIKENKTGKFQNFKMNKKLVDEIKEYVEKYDLKPNDYLFMGQKKKTTYKGITKNVIYPITKQLCQNSIFPRVKKACGIPFTFGLHTLRKTFGYQYIKNGGNVLTLMKMYNHSSPYVTNVYVMWDESDIESDRASIFIGMK